MLPTIDLLRRMLSEQIQHKHDQGHVTEGLSDELAGLPDRYDALAAFAEKVADLPLRDDWPYVEPNDFEAILAECDPERATGPIAEIDLDDAARRVHTAFLSSVCGCVLGKPIEVNPSLAEIRAATEPLGEWPLTDYVSEPALENLGRRHGSWKATVRERIAWVEPDDDVNYTLMGMLVLERHGAGFTRAQLAELWTNHLPVKTTFGPERTVLVKAALHQQGRQFGCREEPAVDRWVDVFNPRDELCGAQIRADAYGYACPGRPDLAAELAWRDASLTHRRTGVYATMWTAAAIAAAQVLDDPLAVFETAQQYIPQRSRFFRIVNDSLEQVREASDWLDGYERIHGKYGAYTHCTVYQESGTLINTLRFADDIGDGIGKQVSQGNDTDSYGATAGSLLGCFFGPGHLEPRWLEPFHDDLHTALAWFYDRSLTGVAERMSRLPRLIAAG